MNTKNFSTFRCYDGNPFIYLDNGAFTCVAACLQDSLWSNICLPDGSCSPDETSSTDLKCVAGTTVYSVYLCPTGQYLSLQKKCVSIDSFGS